jgi:BirA family transcriptional regulator, biotin operon repressor / biotin---[acetyl-CoA-carboxylase] ligase
LSHSFNTISIGKVFIEKDTCHSTNDECKLLLSKSKPPEGTAIITDCQTAGRGQYGNKWQSEAGKNIAISFIVYPNFLAADEQFYLSKIVSLACVKTCEETSQQEFRIKWPNDIYHHSQKVGGILIENQLSGSKLASSVLGIGLNVNQLQFENLPLATSLSEICQLEVDRTVLVKKLIENLDAYYLLLRQRNFTLIDTQYQNKMLGYGETRLFIFANGEKAKARVEGVNHLGQLKLWLNHSEKLINFKEVEWVF